MEETLQQLAEQIEKHIEQGSRAEISNVLAGVHPSKIAEIIDQMDRDAQAFVLSSLGSHRTSEVLPELHESLREELLSIFDEEQIADIAEEMDSDDAADLIHELPEEKAEDVLAKIDPEERMEVEPLLKYPDDSAGGIMQTEVLEGSPESPAGETIEKIRELSQSNQIEEYHRIYVVDKNNKLVGTVSLGKLVISNKTTPLWSIMESVSPETTLSPMTDQEEVALMFRKYDLMSAPVVDEEGKLLGRITGDDIMDVIAEESEEDLLKAAGVGGDHLHPIHTPTFEKIKVRIPWIVLTLLGELLIAFVVLHNFQVTLEQFAILAAFMPAIMAAGGNVGVQTNTVVIRSLGMGTIRGGQVMSILFAEMKVGLILGLLCGIMGAFAVEFINAGQPNNVMVGYAVFIAMISATLATSSIGVVLPMALKKFNIDPAASSGPFLMMFNDILGSIFYLFVGTILLF
ncbi:magnesium transporter [Candidatus Mycalebacterium sp.]